MSQEEFTLTGYSDQRFEGRTAMGTGRDGDTRAAGGIVETGAITMLASMPRLYGKDEVRMADDARRVARKPSNIDVTIASAQGTETPVVIADISTYGCSVGRNADWLKQGVFVWLRAGGEAAVIGVVRWIREEAAGIEFVRPLAPGAYGLASLIDEDI